MANDGSIRIGVEVDSSDAVSGFDSVAQGAGRAGVALSGLSDDAKKSLSKVDDSVARVSGGLDALYGSAQRTGAATSASLNQTALAADNTVEGLDSLKDTSGEASSSMSALAGAVSIVSPEMGAALSGASALAGGLEGASKATKLFGGSVKAMMLTLGPITVALGLAVAAYKIYTSSVQEAEAAELALNEAREQGQDLLIQTRDNLREATVLIGGMTSLEAAREAMEQRHSQASAARNEEWLSGRRDRTEAETQAMLIAHRSARQLEESEGALLVARERSFEASERDREAREASLRQAEIIAAAQQREAAALAEIIAFKEANAALADKAAGANEAARLQAEAEALDEVAAATRRAAEADDKLAASAALAAARQQEMDNVMNASLGAMGGFFDLAGVMAGDNAEDQKALAIAQTTINGLVASIKAFADLGPVAGGIASAGIAASTAAALAQISAQQIPSFHTGGIVGGIGDTPINAQGGEAVLNREAVAGIGVDGVEALNAGGAVGGTVVVEMTYKQRVFDRVVIDNLRKGGPLANAISSAEKRGRRGRVGGIL